MENVADISHLNKIHTSMPFVGRLNSIWDKLTKSLGIFYRGSWTDDPKEPHVAFTQLFVDYKFMSKYSLLQTSIIVKSVSISSFLYISGKVKTDDAFIFYFYLYVLLE